jgi:hypothetical protein
VVRSEVGVPLCAGWVYAQNDRVLLLCPRPTVPEFAKLFGANEGFVSRVEDQNDVFAGQTSQRHGISVLIGKGEVRRYLAHGQRIREQPGEHLTSLLHPAEQHRRLHQTIIFGMAPDPKPDDPACFHHS